jgi:hypothetical protein
MRQWLVNTAELWTVVVIIAGVYGIVQLILYLV